MGPKPIDPSKDIQIVPLLDSSECQLQGNIETTDIIEEVTELPEEGVIGEVVAYGGKLYVWSGAK